MGSERGGGSERSMTKKEVAANKKAVNTVKPIAKAGPKGFTSKSSKSSLKSAKQEEFSTPSGQKYSGTTTSKPSYGPAPMDVQAIIGSTQSEKVKGGITGVAGITTKNLGQLQQKAQIGQIPETIGPIPSPVGIVLNTIGKATANKIIENIGLGGSPVFSTSGEIVGSVDKNALGHDVYTGQVGYNPLGRKAGVTRIGTGYKLGRDTGPQGDGPDRATTTATAPSQPTETVSVADTGLSGAAKKNLQAARASGAARRRFIV